MGMSPQAVANAYERQIIQAVQKAVRPIMQQCLDDANRITFDELEKYAKKVFEQAIDRFYASYSPGFYPRTESLYDVLEIKRGDNKMSIGFLPDEMESGEGTLGSAGLYEQTFKRGWHGGADSASKGIPHPNPGTPYWRAPYGVYKYWSRPAAVSTPPYEEIKSRIEEYGHTVMQSRFNATFQKLWAERTKSIRVHF